MLTKQDNLAVHPDDVVEEATILTALSKIIGKRLSDMRGRIKEVAALGGKGTRHTDKYETLAGSVSVTRSDRVSYNQADLDFLLRSKGIEPKEIGAVTVKPEDGKVSALITSGRLTMRELATAVQTKESERVVIRPSKDINALATQVWNHVQVRGAETPGSKEIGGDDS